MAKAAKTQEVAEAQKADLPAIPESNWGGEGLSKSDIIVPKLLLMQGLSKFVADGTASVGQIRDSLEGKLLGGMVKPKEIQAVDVIPFSTFRTWVVFEKRNGKDEYVSTVPITPENEGLAINEVVNGVEVRRDKCLNFYVLLPQEIKDGAAFPYLIAFRRTSMQAGKKLATMAAKLGVFKKPLASKVVALSPEVMENDKGKFFVYGLAQGRDTSPQELAEAYKWHQALKTASVKIDDSDLRAEAAATQADASTDY